MTCPLNTWKTRPCFGFVFMSVHICLVRQYSMVISPWLTLSLMKKYFALMCLVHFELLTFLFVLSRIALMLPWYRSDASMLYPCACMKYWALKIYPYESLAPTSSISVEFFVFILCFQEQLITIPCLKLIPAPMCPRHLLWTACATSTHHCKSVRQLADRIRGMGTWAVSWPFPSHPNLDILSTSSKTQLQAGCCALSWCLVLAE